MVFQNDSITFGVCRYNIYLGIQLKKTMFECWIRIAQKNFHLKIQCLIRGQDNVDNKKILQSTYGIKNSISDVPVLVWAA